MPSQPPRRRRSQRDDRGLPLLPVLLGVILLGFGVGAVLSMTNSRREEPRREQVAQTQPSPQSEATPQPMPSFVRRARPKLTPYPAVVPTVAHTPTPEPTEPPVAPTSEPTATVAPAVGTPTPTVTLAPPPAISPVVKIPAVEETTAPAPPAATSTPTPKPAPAVGAAENGPVIDVDSEFAQEAAQAVRSYLTALRRGDEDTASADLAPGLSLSEEAFMNSTARITRIHATGTSTDASVQARVVADQDTYVATFSVERGPKGPIIRAHDFVRAK